MSSVKVLTPEDALRLTEIGELTALAYLADGLVDRAHPYVPQLRDAHARAKEAILLMMADGDSAQGAAVGTLTVVPPGTRFAEVATEGEFELRMLAVSPLARGKGVGHTLTRAGMDLAVEMGARRILLSTMESMHAAHRLYEKLGFTRLPERDFWVFDSADGTVTTLTMAEAETNPAGANAGVKLLVYSWEP